MKIVSMESHIVAVPPPHIGGMYWIFVKLRTACGIEGVGEIYSATFHPSAMTHIIDDVFSRYLLDHDPHHVERFWREAYSSGFTQRPDLTMMGVVSGLEMACWDIIGKAAGKPVYELLGGRVHERLRSYTYLYPKNRAVNTITTTPISPPNARRRTSQRGFTAVKFDPAGPYTAYSGHQLSMEVLDRCETFCRKSPRGRRQQGRFAVRHARADGAVVGDPARASVWKNTIRSGSRSRCRPGRKARWRKSPRTPAFRLRPANGSPPSTNSSSCCEARGASILQLNVARVGGLLEAKKVASIAEVYYAQIAPHLYNGPVGAAASIQLATCTPNFLIQESIGTWDGFHAQVLKTPIQLGGRLHHSVARAGAWRRAEHGRRARAFALHRRAAASADGREARRRQGPRSGEGLTDKGWQIA